MRPVPSETMDKAGRDTMGIYKKVYDFTAKAGSLEGYIYPRETVDVSYLPRWVFGRMIPIDTLFLIE